MSDTSIANARGPFEERSWPEDLAGHVTTAGPEPRLHGYAVEDDLAKHYRFIDSAYLCVIGELPSAAVSQALDVTLQFLTPTPVSEGPAHAAVLARTCGADLSATLSISAIALAEQTRHCLEHHAPWLAWLSDPQGEPPPEFVSDQAADAASVVRLIDALRATGMHIAALGIRPTRMAALLAVLHACGVQKPEQLATFMVMAKLPCVMSEAIATGLASFLEYPLQLPPFELEPSP